MLVRTKDLDDLTQCNYCAAKFCCMRARPHASRDTCSQRLRIFKISIARKIFLTIERVLAREFILLHNLCSIILVTR